MEINTFYQKPAYTATVGELVGAIVKEVIANQPIQTPIIKESQKQFAYSIREGADFFHICQPTFQRWKNEGFVKYTQHGRKLIIDLDGTMELLNSKKGKR